MTTNLHQEDSEGLQAPTPSRTKTLILLALPTVVGQISHTLASFADNFMVAQTGKTPLAALGAATPLFLIVFLFFSALFQGVQTICARRVGEGKSHEAGAVLQTALLLGLGLGALGAASGWFVPGLIMDTYAPNQETGAIATEYLQYRWGWGMGLITLAFCFRGFYWGVGLTRTDLLVSLIFNASNVFFNWIFIFGNLGAEARGAAGAGLGSALANAVALLIFVLLTLRPRVRRAYGTFRWRSPTKKIARRIVSLSLPRSGQALAFTHVGVFFWLIGQAAGTDGLAASAIIWRFTGFTVLISIGIGTATATLVSREMGRGRPDEAEKYAWTGVRVGVASVATVATICLVFAHDILGLFFDSEWLLGKSEAMSKHSDLLPDELTALTLPPFALMLCFQVVDSAGLVLARALNGAGEVMFVMYSEFGVAWLVCLPVAALGGFYLLPESPLLGVWCGWAAYCVAWAATMALRWRKGHWKRIQI